MPFDFDSRSCYNGGGLESVRPIPHVVLLMLSPDENVGVHYRLLIICTYLV